MTEKTVDTKSSDHEAMAPYWTMVSAILGGPAAMRQAGTAYLPRFPHEPEPDYQLRLRNAKFTNIFGDIVETLASKPFEKEVEVSEADQLKPYVEDIDGRGNHLHVFSAGVFYWGIADALTWILVDYTKGIPAGATVAEERDLGARPYWVHIRASNVLAAYSEQIGGREVLVHVRLAEDAKERDGYGEVVRRRVRVLNRQIIRNELNEAIGAGPATWELFELQKQDNRKEEWVSVGTGIYSVGEIPLVPFVAGRREGSGWIVKPPLESAAYLQVEHYQQESGLKYAREQTAFPMLAGNGVDPPTNDKGEVAPLPKGPMTVLYAPPNGDGQHGEWRFIEPSAESLSFLSSEVEKTEAQLRELGRQPLTAQSGNITTITAAFAGDKAHTVIEAWALNFKDVLEQALALTSKWIKADIEPEVEICTDFALSMKEDTGVSSLDAARERGDLSQETYWDELKRRGILGPNFDPEAERQRIIEEMPGDPTESEMDAALPGSGKPDPQDPQNPDPADPEAVAS